MSQVKAPKGLLLEDNNAGHLLAGVRETGPSRTKVKVVSAQRTAKIFT